MARPTKPQALHILEGTNRKAADEKRANDLVLPAGAVGDPPEWLLGEGLAEWSRLTQDEHYKVVLSPVHRGALIEYCVLFGRMIEDAKGGDKMNSSQRQTFHSLRMQLGITPASQSKVKMDRPKAPSESRFARIGRQLQENAG